MFTLQQYRAKAAEYAERVETASSAVDAALQEFVCIANPAEEIGGATVEDAAAIANWNNEGGAPRSPRR